ncbi:cysteine hydrolase family protein [Actinocatenispora rupis]|uniref:Isochorismatase-like domain-containing protein n=1 Tax=Actinocatenispora rupis TaxID=519421 RepID=A0A8J3J103_9ACTN|nr:isochorismatase family cysteine hydrolase [Actinocatenispora rupis]GID09526.1 hypothetical protein Aru02nite_04150 [Actinocatenispora rupis]
MNDGVLGLPPERVAVLLVDFQHDFCDGNAGNTAAAHRAYDFAAAAGRLGARTIHSQQVYDPAELTPRQRLREGPDSLCRKGTRGAELVLPPLPGARVVRKHRYDVWQSPEFHAVLADWDVDGLVIAGVELQCCVLYAVLGADEHGYDYAVPQELVSGIDRCDDGSNRAVREYLGLVHPTPTTAELLAAWRTG